MRHEKLKSYQSKYILESVAIPLDTDEQGLKQFFSDLFQDKMDGDKWQLLLKYLLNATSKKITPIGKCWNKYGLPQWSFFLVYVFIRAYAVLLCGRQNMNTNPFKLLVLNNGEKYFTLLSFFSSHSACSGYSRSDWGSLYQAVRDEGHKTSTWSFSISIFMPLCLPYQTLIQLSTKHPRSPKLQPLKISCWKFQCTVCNSMCAMKHRPPPRIWIALCESFWYVVKHTVTAERWKVDK